MTPIQRQAAVFRKSWSRVSTVTSGMPEIRRHQLPSALIQHLSLRIRQREIGLDQMGLFGDWCDTDSEFPVGARFKRFPGMIVCGEGKLVKTFLADPRLRRGCLAFKF